MVCFGDKARPRDRRNAKAGSEGPSGNASARLSRFNALFNANYAFRHSVEHDMFALSADRFVIAIRDKWK